MSSTAINRSLGNVRTELDFLLENKVISKDFYNEFSKRLPQKWDSKQDTSKKFMEAIYNYEPQESTDLRLNVGDKVEILETLSENWSKGRCNGKVGVFPSNYVKPIEQPFGSRPMQPLPPQAHSSTPTYSSNDEKHQLEQQRKQREKDEQKRQKNEEKRRREEEERRRKEQEAQRFQQQQMQQQQQQMQQHQQQQQQQPQQQQPPKKHHSNKLLNKFGSRLGNAVIWGAGSRLGSDLVNSAFNKFND